MDKGKLVTLGDWLAYLLKQARWTQQDLATTSGVSIDTISHIINGVVRARHGPAHGARLDTRKNLAKALADQFDALAQAALVARETGGGDASLSHEEAEELKEETGRLLVAPAGAARAAPMARVVAGSYLTPLIGRADDVERALALLRTGARLLTLTGPPGVGKTRLGLAVAPAAREAFSDGFYVVELAPLKDADAVIPTVARTLGLRETLQRPTVGMLGTYLSDRRLLVLLDNVEHVAAVAPQIGRLLAACPGLTVLATGRAPLHIDGEQELPVEPLLVPPPATVGAARPLSMAEIAGFPAVDLFVQRARAVAPTFTLTEATAPLVAEICRRLDGLPLAIELAAPRIKILSPATLLERLDRRLQILIGGSLHLPLRQRTLRATLDWSCDLLGPGGQHIYRQLAVFAGGCSLDAAEAVCMTSEAPNASPATVLDGLASLVDHSLMRAESVADGDVRFTMLEVVREHAAERLVSGGDAEEIRERHCDWYLGLAERAEPELTGGDQERWLARLETEHDNLRAALRWTLARNDTVRGLRLAGALWRFWLTHGHVSEGRHWLTQTLARAGAGDALARAVAAGQSSTADMSVRERQTLRAKALRGTGGLAYEQGDYGAAGTLYEAALSLYQEIEDDAGIAASINNLGVVADARGDYARATSLYERSLALKRALGDTWGMTTSLNNLGRLALQEGSIARAVALYEEGLELSRELGDTTSIGLSLNVLGEALLYQGAYDRAESLLKESIELARRVGDKRGLAFALNNLGDVALARDNDDVRAQACQEESLRLRRDLGHQEGMAVSLAGLGDVARARSDHVRAASLYQESLSLLRASGDTALILPIVEKAAVLIGEVGSATAPFNTDVLRRAAGLFGATAAVRAEVAVPQSPALRAGHDQAVGMVHHALGDDLFGRAWVEGQARSLGQALEDAITGLKGGCLSRHMPGLGLL